MLPTGKVEERTRVVVCHAGGSRTVGGGMFARSLYERMSEVKGMGVSCGFPRSSEEVGPGPNCCTYKLESSYTCDHHANTISQQHCFFITVRLSHTPSWATHSARFSLAKRYASVAGLR